MVGSIVHTAHSYGYNYSWHLNSPSSEYPPMTLFSWLAMLILTVVLCVCDLTRPVLHKKKKKISIRVSRIKTEIREAARIA